MNNNLRKSILLTLSYFDMFDYPLSLEELNQWLFGVGTVTKELLNEMIAAKTIEEKDSYYFLPTRSSIIDIRQKRHTVSIKKIKKAKRMARLLSFIPGLKMIAICSNLGYLNADIEADIDFFVVTANHRIWTVRFWCNLAMKFLHQRPTPKTSKDKICLSYFVTENNLNLEPTKVGETDIHLIYLLSQYLPIYVEDNLWEKFIQANKWINNYLPNFKYGSEKKFQIKPSFPKLKEIISLTQLPFEERLYQKIQLNLMPKILKSMMNNGTNKVIVNNNILKLHSNDKRDEYNKRLKDNFFKS